MFAKPHFCLPNISGIVGLVEPQWDRLGEAVLRRRTTSGWTQEEVWERGGPSDTLQTEIEAKRWKPTRSTKNTLKKIDIGMRWVDGSASRVLAGGTPTPREDTTAPTTSKPAVTDDDYVDALVQIIDKLHRLADMALERRDYWAIKSITGSADEIAGILVHAVGTAAADLHPSLAYVKNLPVDDEDTPPAQSAYELAKRSEVDPKEDPDSTE